MSISKREFGQGTYLVQEYPYGWYLGGKAICSDGQVRALKRISSTADTFFSVPASVTVKGKTVAGYITVETEEGWSTATKDDPAVVKFIAYTYRKNGEMLPKGSWKRR